MTKKGSTAVIHARTPVKAKYHTDGEKVIEKAISDALIEEFSKSFAKAYVRIAIKSSGLDEWLK